MDFIRELVGHWIISVVGKAALAALATVGGFLVGKFWDGFLLPWIQNYIYQGIYLKPSYKGESVIAGKTINDHIELKQRSSTVKGTMTAPAGKTGKYEFKAKLMNNILRGTFEGIGKVSASRGCFLLEVKAGSDELQGWCLETVGGVIHSYEYKWESRP